MRSFWLLLASINVFTIARGPTWFISFAVALLYVTLMFAFESDE